MHTTISGYILLGGKSSRMGKPKHLIKIGGRTMLDRTTEALMPVCSAVYTVGDDANLADSLANFPDDKSPNAGAAGPLVGIYTALKNCETEWASVLACDFPFASKDLFETLIGKVSDELDAIVPVQPDGRLQPLMGLYRRSGCLEAAELSLRSGKFSMGGMLDRVRLRKVGFEELAELAGSELFFKNINTPGDLHDAEALMSR